jgi:hypothetical protein
LGDVRMIRASSNWTMSLVECERRDPFDGRTLPGDPSIDLSKVNFRGRGLDSDFHEDPELEGISPSGVSALKLHSAGYFDMNWI